MPLAHAPLQPWDEDKSIEQPYLRHISWWVTPLEYISLSLLITDEHQLLILFGTVIYFFF